MITTRNKRNDGCTLREIPALALAILTLAPAAAGLASEQLALECDTPSRSVDAGLPVDPFLLELDDKVNRNELACLRKRCMDNLSVQISDEREVLVEIIGPVGLPAAVDQLLARCDARPGTRWAHRVEAWVPVERLAYLAGSLPSGYRVESTVNLVRSQVLSEGPEVMNTSPYRNSGSDGSGLIIGIIDGDFGNYDLAASLGEVPGTGRYSVVNYTDRPFGSADHSVHGTACAEVIYEQAPGATYYLYQIDYLADLNAAVDHAISHGVDILSLSGSWHRTGWADDSGDACSAANRAAEHNILFFCAAGNEGDRQHWQGMYSPGSDGGSWHQWAPGDEILNVVVPSEGHLRVYLQWDNAGDPRDYDLYLYDGEMTRLSTSTQPGPLYEFVEWMNNSDQQETVGIAVKRESGAATQLEIIATSSNAVVYIVEHSVSASSTTSPSNSTHPNVLSVGAVPHWDYGEPAGTHGILASYSSRGPSNSGMVLPDISAPASTSSFAYAGRFSGTSCAAPHAAGAAAVIWSCSPSLSALEVSSVMSGLAALHKDWGDEGMDNDHGAGGVELPAFEDCNGNGRSDLCDLSESASDDCNGNLVPDECDEDCNRNGRPDDCEIVDGAADCDNDALLDECETATEEIWADDFEAYPIGDPAGLAGWRNWLDDPDLTALVTDERAASGSRALRIDSASDLMQELEATAGRWRLTVWVYTPSDMTGAASFLLLNEYDHEGDFVSRPAWSVWTEFAADDGMVRSVDTGLTLPLIYDEWVELRVEVDLERDLVLQYYDAALLARSSWTHRAGRPEWAAIDVFGYTASAIYYDDLELLRLPEAGDEDCNANGVPDTCDPDDDLDGVPNDCDLCPGEDDSEDADLDGVADCIDSCPGDPQKIEPGICGCGASEADFDGDGVPDCQDGCIDDPDKSAPGICGCGVPDVDSDADDVLDCEDGCPADPDKTSPGECGCGESDRDSDGDRTPDCEDRCPADPQKTWPGDCGCGVSDRDSDGDGVADCEDDCPSDPDKYSPGECGCGESDRDSDDDGLADCEDGCPNDAAKTESGVCGCGVPDSDSDRDGIPDCVGQDEAEEPRPNNPIESQTRADGMCGTGVYAAVPPVLFGFAGLRLRRGRRRDPAARLARR